MQTVPLLATKLQAPAVRRASVGRGELVARLQEGAERRMTVVTAPPGWGKTTLLAAWRLADSERRAFAWVSLDAGDNDPVRFWSYVVEALRARRRRSSRAPCRRAAAGPGQRRRRGRPGDRQRTRRSRRAGGAGARRLPR